MRRLLAGLSLGFGTALLVLLLGGVITLGHDFFTLDPDGPVRRMVPFVRQGEPTAGCTNGTLTFVALTLRSAERIAQDIKR